jgi:hypothetical protein
MTYKELIVRPNSEKTVLEKALIVCGIISSIWYAAINIYVPHQYEGYSLITFTVSELSAINAPTRQLWIMLVMLYPLLFAGFGLGVLKCAGENRQLRITGGLIVFYCIFNLYWPPMHMRGEEATLTDTLHIVWATVTIVLMLLMMAFGAAAFGVRFRIFTITSILLHIVFGVLTSLEAPNIATNGPTPMIGVWERINIAVFMFWVIIFCITLLTTSKSGHKQKTNARQYL